MHRLLAVLMFAGLLVGRSAEAQPWSGWLYTDAAPGSVGAEVGVNYGGKVNFGPALGVFHAWQLDHFVPEVEAYLGMTAEVGHNSLWVYAGGGVLTDPQTTWTGRLSVWWVSTDPIGLFASFYGMWTPAQNADNTNRYLLQPRLGLAMRANNHLQIIPYLQLAVSLPDTDVSVGPGVLALWSW